MPIHRLDRNVAAAARLNRIELQCTVEDAAHWLAKWESDRGSLIVPSWLTLTRNTDAVARPTFYRDRVKTARSQIREALSLDDEQADRISFIVAGDKAWYLGPKPKLRACDMVAAARSEPATFLRLMLQKRLLDEAAFAEDIFVRGGFGPGVFLGHKVQGADKYIRLCQAVFDINAKFNSIGCDISSHLFMRVASESGSGMATRLAHAGEGFLVPVSRISPRDYVELDGRKARMDGVSLAVDSVRTSRLYYLNLVTEFAARMLTEAEVPYRVGLFEASHFVDDGYVPFSAVARLASPLVVVNATVEPIDCKRLADAMSSANYLTPYHTAGGKKVSFAAPSVEVFGTMPEVVDYSKSYLFLNGQSSEGGGSVRYAKSGLLAEMEHTIASSAYASLAKGEGVADLYTHFKFSHLLSQKEYRVVSQGINCSPAHLSALPRRRDADTSVRQLQESIKRCYVEISLKEVLRGLKGLTLPGLDDDTEMDLTLVATRSARVVGRRALEQMISAIDVQIRGRELRVTRARRTPWEDTVALFDLAVEFPFLQDRRGRIKDAAFWVIDRRSSERVTAWAGQFVPKIILNDVYESVETAIAAQACYLEERKLRGFKGRLLSKGREYNLLPYYISMYKFGHWPRGERIGRKIPLQDCGSFVRFFVPPEGGLNGSGDALSGMRDLMHYSAEGEVTNRGLLDQPLVRLYLHTMTNGILVGGDNSKMSVLEKLARLAIQN